MDVEDELMRYGSVDEIKAYAETILDPNTGNADFEIALDNNSYRIAKWLLDAIKVLEHIRDNDQHISGMMARDFLNGDKLDDYYD